MVNNMVNVTFYGDHTTAKMYISTLVSFEQGLKTYVKDKRLLLDKAVKEALFEKFQDTLLTTTE